MGALTLVSSFGVRGSWIRIHVRRGGCPEVKVGSGGGQEEICSLDRVAPVCIRERQILNLSYEFAEEVRGSKGEIRVLEVAKFHQGLLMFLELIDGNFPAESKFNAPQRIKRIPVRVQSNVGLMKFTQVVVDLSFLLKPKA